MTTKPATNRKKGQLLYSMPLNLADLITDQIINEYTFNQNHRLKFDLKSRDFQLAHEWLFGTD